MSTFRAAFRQPGRPVETTESTTAEHAASWLARRMADAAERGHTVQGFLTTANGYVLPGDLTRDAIETQAETIADLLDDDVSFADWLEHTSLEPFLQDRDTLEQAGHAWGFLTAAAQACGVSLPYLLDQLDIQPE